MVPLSRHLRTVDHGHHGLAVPILIPVTCVCTHWERGSFLVLRESGHTVRVEEPGTPRFCYCPLVPLVAS